MTTAEIAALLKERFPDKKDVTILLEPDTAYDTLVQVMDSARTVKVVQDGQSIMAELFPEISIGDAPIIAQAQATGTQKGAKR